MKRNQMCILLLAQLTVLASVLACSPTSTTGGGEGEGEGEGESAEGEGESAEGEGEGAEGEGEGEGAVLPDPATLELAGRCPLPERVGQFTVERQDRFGVVQGSISDGVVPTAVPDEVDSTNGCKLLRRRTLNCTPACVAGETCGDDGACIPFPRQLNAGTVTIEGLTSAVAMEPRAPSNGYFAPGVSNPPFTPDQTVRLTAAGSDVQAGFTMLGVGVEPLTEEASWLLVDGQALQLTWPAPTGPINRAHVEVEMTIDQHGLSPLLLRCKFDDTGSAEVPAEAISTLISSGVSGFPNGKITRQTVDSVDVAQGCVEFVVGSPVVAAVRVDGETPCNTNADCPAGQTCNVPLQRCE
jgi:hypothetical protein